VRALKRTRDEMSGMARHAAKGIPSGPGEVFLELRTADLTDSRVGLDSKEWSTFLVYHCSHLALSSGEVGGERVVHTRPQKSAARRDISAPLEETSSCGRARRPPSLAWVLGMLQLLDRVRQMRRKVRGADSRERDSDGIREAIIRIATVSEGDEAAQRGNLVEQVSDRGTRLEGDGNEFQKADLGGEKLKGGGAREDRPLDSPRREMKDTFKVEQSSERAIGEGSANNKGGNSLGELRGLGNP